MLFSKSLKAQNKFLVIGMNPLIVLLLKQIFVVVVSIHFFPLKGIFGICCFFFIILYTHIKAWLKHLNETSRLYASHKACGISFSFFFFDRITFPFPIGQSRKQFMSIVNQGEKVIIERPLFPPPIKLKTAILISTVENWYPYNNFF